MGPLFNRKELNLGFVVICVTANLGHLKTTLNSLRCHHPERPYIAVCPEDMTEANLVGLKVGPVVRNGGSPASQINTGIAKATWKEWCMVIQAGTWVRSLIDVKFSHFIESEKDILFPIMDRLIHFTDAAWNGTLIHKKAVEDIGPFPENNPEGICKLLWALDAIQKGYKFKGVVGATLR